MDDIKNRITQQAIKIGDYFTKPLTVSFFSLVISLVSFLLSGIQVQGDRCLDSGRVCCSW